MCRPPLCYILPFLVASIVPAGNVRAQIADWIGDEFADVAQHRVDLSAVQVIELTADAVIESSAPDSPDELFLGNSVGIARLGGTLFVADRVQNVVLVADLTTNYFVDSFGSPGEGPGEFGQVMDILVESDRLYILDGRRGGVHVFNRDFQALDFVRQGPAAWNQFAVAGNRLIVRSRSREAGQLFEVRSRLAPYSPEGTLGKAIPKRIPAGWGNNHASVAGNRHGQIAFAWTGQPVVVVYNRQLEATDLITVDGIDACSRNKDDQERVYRCFLALKIDDASNIFVRFRHYVLRLSGWREGRPVVNLFALSDKEGTSEVSAWGLDVKGDEVYVSTRESSAIYRYTIPGG